MENIVMAASTGQPVADGKIFAGNCDAKAGGLFGMLVARELELLAGPEKGGEKKAAASDPMMMLLMSALLPGIARSGMTDQGFDETGIGIAAGKAAQVAGGNGPGAKAQALALLKVLAGGRGIGEALKDPAAGVDGGNGAFLAELAAALQEQPQAGAAQLTAEEKQAVQSLLEALQGSKPGVPAYRQAQGRPAALEEIRKLFAELIADGAAEPAQDATTTQAITGPEEAVPVMAKAETSPAVTTAAGQAAEAIQPAAQPGDQTRWKETATGNAILADKPVEKIEQLLTKVETLLKGMQAGLDGESQPQAEETAIAAGKEALGEEVKQTKGKQEPAAFHAAFQAYHVRETAASAETRVGPGAVQAATRPGAEAFDSIVQSISGMKDSVQKEMEIHLKPSFLGKVVIRLSMEEGGLVAKIAAANPRVQDAFLNQAGTLQAALSEQGLKDVRVVVTSTSVQDPGLQQQADRRSQEQRGQQKRHRTAAVEATETTGGRAMMAYEALVSAGTINYLA